MLELVNLIRKLLGRDLKLLKGCSDLLPLLSPR
jgi:hypothetical protein